MAKQKSSGWLDKYEPGGTVAASDNTRVATPVLKLTKQQLEKNKAVNAQVLANTKKAKEVEVAKRTAARNKPGKTVSEVFTNEDPYNIQERFRLFPDDTEYGQAFDEYINPAYFVGQMSSNLANSLQTEDYKGAATTAALALGVGVLGFDPLGNTIKAPGRVAQSMESGLLSNTHKLNPWAFKPQEGMMYRGLGEEGAKDAIESGVFRPKQLNYPEKRTFAEIVTSPKQFGSTYYAPAKKFGVVDNYGSGFIAEVPFEGNPFGKRYGRKDWSYKTSKQIPVSEGRLLQKDWLQRYKPIKEDGGWLDKYNDGGPVQENYNDYSVSASEGFQGDGYSNVGRNYSPAWGGQFAMGGKLSQFQQGGETPIYVTDKNDPRLKAYKDSLDVRTRSNQTFKPGSKTRPLTKKEQEFWKDEKTGLAPNLVERIGPGQDYFGHFKKPTQPIIYQKPQPKPTSQEIIDWIEGNTRDENAPTRLGTSEDEKQYAMGGEMPTDKKSQKFYNTLKDYYTSPDRTLVEKAKYAAFNQLNEKYGYAPVKIADRTITGKRSMINPFTGRLNLVVPEDPEVGEIESVPQKLMDAYMHEYGHYQQYNQNPEESKLKKSGRFLGHMFTDFGNMFKNTKGFNFTEGYQKNYETPGTIEHEAHRVIQPKLEEELLNLGRQNFRNRYSMAMGGSMPGAVGFTYARTINPAPSKGPYGKKTVASAQNGTEMRYYQEGLDFKPKTISKNGSELKKLDQLTNFTNYNPTKPSGWLEKYQ